MSQDTPRWGIEKGGWRNGKPVAQAEAPRTLVFDAKIRVIGEPAPVLSMRYGAFVTTSGRLGVRVRNGAFLIDGEPVPFMWRVYPCTVD